MLSFFPPQFLQHNPFLILPDKGSFRSRLIHTPVLYLFADKGGILSLFHSTRYVIATYLLYIRRYFCQR